MPANEVCKGYVFTDVCLSTVGWGVSVQEGLPDRNPPWTENPWTDTPPPPYGNVRAVRILLECILVMN